MTNKEKLKSISTPAEEDWLKIAEEWEMADSFEEFVVLAGVNNNTTEYNTAKTFWLQSAKEQKAIDDAELARLKKAWEKEAEINHDAEMAYKQGLHDAVDKACEVYETKLRELKRILNDKYGAGDIISIGCSLIDFRKAVEEEL